MQRKRALLRAIAADDDERVNLMSFQLIHCALLRLELTKLVAARSAEDGAATMKDAAHIAVVNALEAAREEPGIAIQMP